METATKTYTRRVEIKQWKCNGSINPLIRNAEQLKQVAGPEYREAGRWIMIQLGHAYDHRTALTMPEEELTEIIGQWYERKATPIWRQPGRVPVFHHKERPIYTAAQALAVLHCLHCRAECVDLADLLCCFDFIGSYNNWDCQDGKSAFKHFDLRQYFNENNPNNGGHLFKYHFGWEGSHVVYIDCNFYMGCKMLDRAKELEADFSPDDFAVVCQAIGRRTHADECDLSEDRPDFKQWRLWWD